MSPPARRLVHVLTVPDSLGFIEDQVVLAKARGYEVLIVTSSAPRLAAFGARHGVATVGVDMPRRVSPGDDWRALARLHGLFLRWRPAIVHAHTPKGGLLGTLAAEAAGVPVRLYQMRGLVAATQRGVMRAVTLATERLSCAAATRVLCQSPSLRAEALALGLVPSSKSGVLLGGSNGVDADVRFDPRRHAARRGPARRAWGLPEDALVFAFVGRLVRDKGIPELLAAFERLAAERTDVWLLLAGPLEARDALDEATRRALDAHPRVRSVGFTDDTPAVYAAADVVVLPSHREGFPNVPLEAAAMERPVVSTRVSGCVDAVDDGVTGLLVGVGDAGALAQTMARYAAEPELRARHGRAGRARVERSFRRDRIAAAMVDLYDEALAALPERRIPVA